jgi:hypothetical protein
MFFRRTVAIGFLAVALAPAAARADGLFIPFAGVNFGGRAGQSLGDAFDAKRFNWGGSLAWMGGGVFGFEGDVGYSHDFFGKTDLGGSSVLTLMGNMLLGIPFGGQEGFGIRPYGVVGIGLLHSDLESFEQLIDFDETETVWNFGGGVMIFFTSHVGLRGDIRYFRTFDELDFRPVEDADAVDYARASAGLLFRF